MKLFILLQSVVFLFFSISCSSRKEPNKISWHKTGMESALQEATKLNKPLFVYWGASWCPPCASIKSRVFTHAHFIQETKNFIPVYLDGDSKSAQHWGEKLKARGYPTLMILSPDGKEITRLSYSLSKEAFAEALKSLYANLHPIQNVVKTALNGSATEGDWSRIASHSWEQDFNLQNNLADWSKKFQILDEKIPLKLRSQKERIFITYLGILSRSLKKQKKNLTAEQKNKYRKRLKGILNSPDLAKENLANLSYSAHSFINFLYSKEDSPEKKSFINTYLDTMDHLRESTDDVMKRLTTLFALLGLSTEKDGKYILSKERKHLLKTESLYAIKKSKTGYERLSVLNSASYFLVAIGLTEQVRKILKKELSTALSPHYLMSSLSYLEKESGNKTDSLSWSKKAYEKSTGKATRLQWAAKHLKNLISLSPENRTEILKYTKEIFFENLKMTDAFVGRNGKILSKINGHVSKWSQKQKQTGEIEKIKKSALKECVQSNFYKNDLYKKSCLSFFNSIKG